MDTNPMSESADKEVEFISEGPSRPVLEYIDLLSDEDDDERVPSAERIDDQVDRKKAQVASTLDRLARQVAVEKQERAAKCKAFKEKIITQQAHGRKELACNLSNGSRNDAKHCVDMWLKMPGLKPGVLYSGSRWGHHLSQLPPCSRSSQTCPVINCGRVYESMPLLDGHLKRFDHSPCDPSIFLKGTPSALYACVACCQQFHTTEEYQAHIASKASSPNSEGHVSTLTCQLIQCFACPACYLLFNIRDQCLQHMSAKNHFVRSITLSADIREPATPIPVPRYAKNRLIVLCKEVPFRIKCTECAKVLSSHMDARAHFNVRCRQGGVLAEADKTVVQVMKQLQVIGHCSTCGQIFQNKGQVEQHRKLTEHNPEIITTVEKSILHYSNYYETLHSRKSLGTQKVDGDTTPKKREKSTDSTGQSSAKRQRLDCMSTSETVSCAVAWFCQCGQQFSDETAANKHLKAANQVFYKCAVCEKLMGEASIARLHMSRMHGGAHLSSFLFWCRRCKLEMPREEDILLHVSAAHNGHNFYQERTDVAFVPEVTEKSSLNIKPSKRVASPRVPRLEQAQKWLCRMCEDIFDSHVAVQKHCQDPSCHSFQRFWCGLCQQKFFKESTLRRHSQNEHGGQVDLLYFCGLCDSMQYDSEKEFLQHYSSIHAKDYYRIVERKEDPTISATATSSTAENPDQLCPCMGIEKSKHNRNMVFTQCMKRLASENQCCYVCTMCSYQTSSYTEIKSHMHRTHQASKQDKAFTVMCGFCEASHKDVPSFHTHYHSQHCTLKPCPRVQLDGGTSEKNGSNSVLLVAQEISPTVNVEEFDDVSKAFSLSSKSSEVTKGESGEFDNLKQRFALSVEDARQRDDFERDMQEALKRSLQEF